MPGMRLFSNPHYFSTPDRTQNRKARVHVRHQILKTIRFRADDQSSNASSSQILLVLDPFVQR